MGSAVKMRTDYSAAELRRLAKASKDANQSRRLLSLALVRDGRSREEAAKIGGMDRQTLRDWVAPVQCVGARGPQGRLVERTCASAVASAKGGIGRDRGNGAGSGR